MTLFIFIGMLNRMLQWTAAALLGASPAAFSATNTTNYVVIPFKHDRGHVMLGCRLNGGQTVSLMVDTGYGMIMLHPDLVEPVLPDQARRVDSGDDHAL